jgi:hypothetical protein
MTQYREICVLYNEKFRRPWVIASGKQQNA